MDTVRVLIVDDEKAARERLVDLLAPKANIEIVGLCPSGEDAIEAIRNKNPDLVFLDVQMPGMDGLTVVDHIGPEEMPLTMFVTAYDGYAIEAFRRAAFDYLLKPYDDDRFEEVLERAREQLELETGRGLTERMEKLLEASSSDGAPEKPREQDYLERIAVERRDRILVVPVETLRYVTAEGPYVKLHTDDGVHLIRERLKRLEEDLNPRHFTRIHRSTLVNLECIHALVPRPRGGYDVELHDGTRLKISRSRRKQVEERVGLSS